MEFYRCRHCGNIVAYVNASGVDVVCCGEKMEKIVENTVEASTEKHLPVITREGNHVHVAVGSIEHPMEEKHYIQWIALETKNGNQRKILKPGDKPAADFCVIDGDEVIKAYEYCNIHGLWSTKF
ncbi:MAG: desulfoferrodoxin [Alphaproteobacteria bacterium]|nr:desulfoferrodoxin [Alphaproteobacteria bacterium]MBP5353467.1 desulfoferrodoxin [Alphaproteobacteria bacterium]